MEADRHEDPTAKGDRVAALMLEYYERNRPRWWRKDATLSPIELMLGLLQIMMWEHRHDWPPAVKEGKSAMASWWRRRIDNYHHYPNLIEVKAEIERSRDLILEKMETEHMATKETLDRLNNDVRRNTDAAIAAKLALEGFVATVADLTAKLQVAIEGGDEDAIKAAADALEANNETLTASIPATSVAVAANT